jgi:hypothetical protein
VGGVAVSSGEVLNEGTFLPIEADVRRVVAAAVAVLLVGIAGSAEAAPGRPRVLLFGDSLLVEAAGQIRSLAADAGVDVEVHAGAGTAICDWQREAGSDRDRFRPDVSVLAFVGNNLTPCTGRIWGPALGLRYGRDLDAMSATLRRAGPVYVVRPPARRWWDVTARAVEAAYADAADARTVRLIDGRRYISPFGVWSATQPCLPDEPCTGPVVAGLRTNVVRAPDALHLCPTGFHDGRCDDWSSGAYRYALDIMEPVLRDLGR